MKIRSITRLVKTVDYTTDYTSFDVRLRFAEVDSKYVPLLWDIYRLLKFTDFTPEHVKKVFEPNTTYQDIADSFELSLGAIKAEVHNFSKKLAEIFQGDIIEDILDKNEISEEYFKNVSLIVADSLERRAIDLKGLYNKSFSVDILNVSFKNEELTKLNSDEFLNLRNKIVSFSIPLQEYEFKKMSNSHKQYISYLLNTKDGDLEELDRKRKKEILNYCQIR